MKIGLLSNINMDYLGSNLAEKHDLYQPDGFGQWGQELLNAESKFYAFNPEAVFLFLDGEELIRGCREFDSKTSALNDAISIIEHGVASRPDTSFFISNLDLPQKEIKSVKEIRNERRMEFFWLDMLEQLNQKYANFYIFDLKHIIETHGRKKMYSSKLWYLGSMKFSMDAILTLTSEVERLLNAVAGKKKKCLILDLDNTLWGGVIGEDGINNIELSEFKEGARYKDFQKRISELKDLGVILAVVSKNNYDDALEVFENHHHMVLNESDFVALKINWDHKFQNINELAEELNLGLDSFVFIDDNQFERESVSEALPDVLVPDFPKDTSMLEDLMIQLHKDHFLFLKSTTEDKQKTQMYKQNLNRKTALKSKASLDDFLKTLNTQIAIWKITQDDITRVSQLTQKTNQFNLTTKRYTEKDIQKLKNSKEHEIYVVSVEDKYGDNGIVSVVILNKQNDHHAEIDTFLMSCRVMERKIEDQILDFVEQELFKQGFSQLSATYIPTMKNKPVELFYDRMSYVLFDTKADGGKEYHLELKNKPDRVTFAKVIER